MARRWVKFYADSAQASFADHISDLRLAFVAGDF
jgi:hypothetical protein